MSLFRLFFPLQISSQTVYFWAPPGTQKSIQNRLLALKLVPQVDFLCLFWPFLCFVCFLPVLGSIFDDFSMFFSVHFSTSPFLFFKPPDLQSHRHGQCFEHLSCFPLFCFFAIFCRKNRLKMEAWKNVEKQALPASKMVPKALRIHAPNPENPQNGLQNLNFGKSIF